MIILTDWMAARMIGLGWIQPLDKKNVPNLHKNLIKSLQGRATGTPTREYHAPWQSGLTGIAYNADEVGEVGSFEELITRSDLKGKITLLSEMPDTMGFFLKVTGADPETFDDDDWANAIDLLRQVIDDGQLLQFAGNNYLQQLSQGRPLRLRGVVGRRDPGAVRQPGPQVRRAGGGPAPLERQHDDPQQGHPPGERRDVDRLLLPARRRGQARLLGQLHLSGRTAPARRWRRSIPSLAENPLIFPDDAMLDEHVRLLTLDDREQQVRRRVVGCHHRLRPPRRPRPRRRTTGCG